MQGILYSYAILLFNHEKEETRNKPNYFLAEGIRQNENFPSLSFPSNTRKLSHGGLELWGCICGKVTLACIQCHSCMYAVIQQESKVKLPASLSHSVEDLVSIEASQ